MRGDHGKQAAVFHGQGAERDAAKEDLARFFRIVDAALHDVLRDDQAPLFLAGVQYLAPIFRDVSSYPQIADEVLPGNPEHLSGMQLHERAWPLMVRRIDALRQSAAARYRELAGTGKASSSIRRIVPTAFQGQIESLFVDRGSHQWGTFDAATGDVQLRAAPGPDTDDLLDFAATQTALNRGQVFAMDRDEMPAHAVAAVFRY
jgi:hypothetical protein